MSIVFTPHQVNFSLQLTVMTTGNHSQSIYRVMDPNPNGYIHQTHPHLRLREHDRREGREIVRAGGSGSLL